MATCHNPPCMKQYSRIVAYTPQNKPTLCVRRISKRDSGMAQTLTEPRCSLLQIRKKKTLPSQRPTSGAGSTSARLRVFHHLDKDKGGSVPQGLAYRNLLFWIERERAEKHERKYEMDLQKQVHFVLLQVCDLHRVSVAFCCNNSFQNSR